MKKLFTLVLAVLLVAALAVAASADYAVLEEVAPDAVAAGMFGDSYPYSVDYDWPECTSDPVIKGTVITGMPASGSHCWSNGTDNASCAFDGDTQSFFDPSEATMESWCGLKLDQAYELSEVRICNRSGQEVRIIGAAIQGSNDDGATWYNVVYFDPAIYGSSALLTNDYHIVTPAKNDAYVEIYQDYMTEEQADFSVYWVGNGSYSMYRYVNLVGTHGDCAEIELYGHPAEAKNSDKGSIAIITDDIDNFGHDYEVTDVDAAVTDGSIAGKVIGGGGAYSDTASYACAFDGDAATFYDPATAGPSCFTGIQTSEPYALTSVKVLPRESWHARTLGATIQGSNDGHAWTTLASFAAEDILADDAERVFLTKEITDTNGYTMFRYVSDGQSHGDVAEVCFYGAPAAAAAAPAAAASEVATPELSDDGRKIIVTPKAETAPTLDNTKDACYGPSYKLTEVCAGEQNVDAYASYCWNGDTLYGFIEVADTTPFTNYGGYWNGDYVEMYFDLDNTRPDTLDEDHFRFRLITADQDICIDTSECTSGYDVDYTNAVVWTDKGYTMEFAYVIPTGLSAETEMGYDISVADGNEDDGARTRHVFLGNGGDTQWQVSSANGCILYFTSAAPAAAAAPAADGAIVADEGRELILVPGTKTAPTLDNVKDDCYGETYVFDAVYAGKDPVDGKISYCWNGNFLYGFLEVADTTPFTNYGSYYNGDNLEMYFDLDNTKPDTLDGNHFRFRILPADQDIVWSDEDYTGDYEVNYTNFVEWTDTGYTLEFAYEIPTGITENYRIGYDMGLCDGNEEAGARTGYVFLGADTDQQWKMASANGCTMVFAAAPVSFGVQEATGSFDGEVADNLFDGDETTKWCFDSTAFTEPYVIWNVENPINVTGYEIVTANDNADYTGRNPGAWTLSGSADGQSWTVIADVAEDKVLQDVNFTPFTFAADAAGEYSWFKYEIKNVVGGGVCQISGLNLLTGDVTPSEAPAEEAVEEEVVEEEVVEEAPVVEEVVAEAPAVEEEAPQTFDFAIIAAVAAIASLAGYTVSKKH